MGDAIMHPSISTQVTQAKLTVEKEVSVCEVFRMFKDALTAVVRFIFFKNPKEACLSRIGGGPVVETHPKLYRWLLVFRIINLLRLDLIYKILKIERPK